jgi:SAM-dependent methyltransferase
VQGVGETLPFPNGLFDLIVCHTVIEHVHHVPSVIAEMARTLSSGGVVHLDAPNYLWPREPHIDVWCLPLLGKPLVRLSAHLQGKAHRLWYLDHLQFVHPRMLERLFARNDLTWHNRVEDKMLDVLRGDGGGVKEYRRLGRLMGLLDRAGVGALLARLALFFGIYPSVMYSLHRRLRPGQDKGR